MIALGPDQVHVWTASRDDATDAEVEGLRGLLTDEERRRADRFVSPLDRRRFAVGRGRLRVILGRYLDQDPESIRFAHNPQGKPSLESGPLRFNLAHSGSLVLFALTLGRELGVDIEAIRPDFGGEAIARRFFAPGEVASLLSLPPGDRTLAFFQGWTRKEAYIKAQGQGLSMPLDEFEVEIRPGCPARLVATRPDPLEAARWTLIELPMPTHPGYVAALCVRGQGWTLKRGDWSDEAVLGTVQIPPFVEGGADIGCRFGDAKRK